MIKKYFELKNTNINLNYIYLIHGKNEGLQKQILDENFLKDFKGSINKYEQNEFIENYDIILNEILTKSLFEIEKVIIISRADDKISKYIEEILDKNLKDIKIILKSSILEKKSKLRNLFEKEKNVICTPVYEDDSRSLNFVINNFLKIHKFNLSQEIKNILIERSKGDRINLNSELSKLRNLSMSKNIISTDDVLKLSNLAENYSVFELSDNYLAKNSKKISNILNENNYSDEDCILIIRTILNKSKRLLKIRYELDKNENIDQVISGFKPPIFWKEKDIVKKQAQSWSTNEVKEIIYKINDLEAIVKKNTANSMLFVSNFVSNY